jgi:hypothetical protein
MYYAFIIVSAADQAEANQIATEVYPGGEDNRYTFMIELSASGQLPATHYCALATDDETTAAAIDAQAALRLPSYTVYRWDTLDPILAMTNRSTAAPHIGEQWDFTLCLEDAGLKRVEYPIGA